MKNEFRHGGPVSSFGRLLPDGAVRGLGAYGGYIYLYGEESAVKRRIACALLSCLATATTAMRLSDIQEYATLATNSVARSAGRSCLVAGGTTVQVIGRPTSLSDKGPRADMFVRVVTGSCVGYGLTIAEDGLTDLRETLEPSALPRGGAKAKR